jgi:hypothetical protein
MADPEANDPINGGDDKTNNDLPACCQRGASCAHGKTCGMDWWTFFNVTAVVLTLASTTFMVFAETEWVSGNRVTYLNAYKWFALAWFLAAFSGSVIVFVTSWLGFTVQRTPNPSQFQYGPIRALVLLQLFISAIQYATIQAYAVNLPAADFDLLNTVSVESATLLATEPTLLLKWQTILSESIFPCVVLIMAFFVHLHGEMYPLRKKGSAK